VVSIRILDGEEKKCMQNFGENPLQKWSRGELSSTWENNMKMDLKEIPCEVGRWIEQVQDFFQWGVLVLVLLNHQVVLLEN
jgi:hypothetical protein